MFILTEYCYNKHTDKVSLRQETWIPSEFKFSQYLNSSSPCYQFGNVTCLFIVCIALVTPFIAWAIALLDLNVCIFKLTAWMFARIRMNFFTYLLVLTRSFAIIFTASCNKIFMMYFLYFIPGKLYNKQFTNIQVLWKKNAKIIWLLWVIISYKSNLDKYDKCSRLHHILPTSQTA